MRNVHTEIKGTKLIVTIDLAATPIQSKSGKSQVIASTEGNTSVGYVKLGVNCYTTDVDGLRNSLKQLKSA